MSAPEDVRSLSITGTVTLNNIFAVIDQIHQKSLVTADAHSAAGKLWVNSVKCHPIEKAEDCIQMYLRIGLATWFPTCDIRWEERSVAGRLDLKIGESDALDKTRVTRHAILELKVLRSFGRRYRILIIDIIDMADDAGMSAADMRNQRIEWRNVLNEA